jgi:hypothetical protein
MKRSEVLCRNRDAIRRNHLAREYFRGSVGLMWKAVCEGLPALPREMVAAGSSIAAVESGKTDGRRGFVEGSHDQAIEDDPVDL